MSPKPRLLMLTRYARLGSSSRLRMLQYCPLLEAAGFHVEHSYFFDDNYLRWLYDTDTRRMRDYVSGLTRRIFSLIRARDFSAIWIEKELFPFLPSLFERWLIQSGIPYAVDFDDATFHRYDQHSSRFVRYLLRNKHDWLIRSATYLTVGNDYLADYARAKGGNAIVVLPTVVDLDRYSVHSRSKRTKLRVGWIGSPSTARYLGIVEPAVNKFIQQREISLVIIGAGRHFKFTVPTEQHPWSEDTEVELLQSLDVGVMPLTDGPWERGKCGFKLIQYMACGLPVVASGVGMNKEIVTDDCGFL
ncbi:glycosyltransferase, partial [Thiohalocapsa marina]|uniref:glycosyltransferase n=1 Tax=Thiohalocapsa marina TaxID=424902 RepID=UPI0036DD0E8D